MTLHRATSEASVARLLALMADRDALLVPGHDVPVEIDEGGQARRTRPQEASLSVFLSPANRPTSQLIRTEGQR